MPNWALVIGCDGYRRMPGAALNGAVADALEMRRWLLSPRGGAVPPQNLKFLASCSEGGAQVPAGVIAGPADRDDVVLAVADLFGASDGDTGMLFVYFSGHGMSATLNFLTVPALACADFSPELTTKALYLLSLKEYFLASSLSPQFFVLDACRDVPFEGAYEVSGMDRPATRDLTRPPPDQYECSATWAGARAREAGAAGDERGVFTKAWLRGLAGEGRAKRYDPTEQRYIVRFEELFEYACAEVESQQAGDDRQHPTRSLTSSQANPVLASFPAGSFPSVELEVTVEPQEQLPAACLEVVSTDDSKNVPAPLPAQLRLRLEPRSWSLRARAPGWASKPRGVVVDLYQTTARQITLEPVPPDAPAPGMGLSVGVQADGGGAFRDLDNAARPARLLVRSDDPLATVEVVDESGSVRSALGRVELSAAGLYRVRVRTPEEVGPELAVDLSAGTDEDLEISQPAAREPICTLDSLLEALPGLPALSRRASAIVVVLRGEGAGRLAAVARTERNEGAFPTSDSSPSLSVAVLQEQPGQNLLRLAGLGAPGVELAVATLLEARRPTLVVVDVGLSGGPAISQLQLPASEEQGELQSLRAAELAERFVRHGRFADALALLDRQDLPAQAIALRGYLALAVGEGSEPAREAREAREAATSLLSDWPSPPVDAALLFAMADLRLGAPPEEARAAIGEALGQGWPVIDLGLSAVLALFSAPGATPPQLPGGRVPRQVVTAFAISPGAGSLSPS